MKVRALLGKKVGMTQIFSESGEVVPVSVIKAGPCVVLEKKSSSGKDGYTAIKLGYEPTREKTLVKPEVGYFKKLDAAPMKYIREIRMSDEQMPDYEVGSEITASIFQPGDMVTVIGKMKGRGFSGVMKRHNFQGKNVSHGTHKYERHGGSVGCSTWPSRIVPGKKMPGQYGNTQISQENLVVVKVMAEEGLLLVRGSIPGARNTLLTVRTSKKKWKREKAAQ